MAKNHWIVRRNDNCGWCAANNKCIRHLVKAMNVAPGYLAGRIHKLIESLRRDNSCCEKKTVKA